MGKFEGLKYKIQNNNRIDWLKIAVVSLSLSSLPQSYEKRWEIKLMRVK